MKDLIKHLIYPFIFIVNILRYIIFKSNSKNGFYAFRFFFSKSNGAINDFINKLISFFTSPISPQYTSGILGTLSPLEVTEIVSQININGYFIFKKKLTKETLEQILFFAKNTPLSHLDLNSKQISYNTPEKLFDPKTTISPRFQFKKSQLLISPRFSNSCLTKIYYILHLLI